MPKGINMKKVIIFILIIVMCLSSCGGLYRINELYCSDFFYGKHFKINYGTPHGITEADFFTTFLCNDDVSELYEKLSDLKKEYSFTIIDNNTIKVQYTIGEKQIIGFVMLKATAENNEKIKLYGDYKYRYCFWDFEGNIKLKDMDDLSFVFPFNLIDFRQGEFKDDLEPNTKYATAYTISDFLDFYEQYGCLDISEFDGGFTINGVTNNEIAKDIAFPITFTFYSEENGNLFAISVPQAKTEDEST